MKFSVIASGPSERVPVSVPVAPLRLTPLLVPKPWGGRRLTRFGRELPAEGPIGESWDVADLDAAATSVQDPCTRVADGPATGRTLTDLLAADAAGLMGSERRVAGRFPLLVKTLDAPEHRAVQVHPPAAYTARDPAARLKTETWVVLDAEPGAELFIGVRRGVTFAEVGGAAGGPDLPELLRCVPARPGEVHHLPAGLIHALGAGVTVAEVQTPSDTTFRLYDWTERYQRPERNLHLEEALRAVELAWEVNISTGHGPPRRAAATGTVEANDHYRIEHHELPTGGSLWSPGGRVRVLYVLDGEIEVTGHADRVGAGGVRLLPAVWWGTLRATSAARLLSIVPE
jgi:mannose-6-phosphate isomerase